MEFNALSPYQPVSPRYQVSAEGAKVRTAREIWIACLALGLLMSGAAAAQDGGCAPPRPWSEATARHGRPEAEVGACLKAQAWETRDLNVPVRSAAAGVVAQCEVRVIFFEGPAGSASRTRAQQRVDANDRVAVDQALADVAWSRRCAGR
jgi:hypothetical protein